MKPEYREFLRVGEEAGARYALVAPRKLPSGLTGSRLGHQAGSSLEFREHRDYQPGDDLRRIDWGVYGRSDKLTVKLYQDEVLPHVDIVMDGSRSMVLTDTVKGKATLGLAAVLASASRQAGFSHCAWVTDEGCQRVVNGTSTPSLWDDLKFEDQGNPLLSFSHQPPTWRPQSIRVLISDLLWMGDPLQFLGYFADRSTHILVLQVLAKQDMLPPPKGYIELVDSESGEVQDVYIDAVAQQRYTDAFSRHQQHWMQAARQVGAMFSTVVAEDIVDNWHLDDLVASEILQVQ